MAEQFDRARFSGPIGELLAATQADVLRDYAGPAAAATVLDVGTGTGRAALVLAEAGARVTAVDASAEMLRVAEARADGPRRPRSRSASATRITCRSPIGAFDTVVSLRVLMHTPDWRQCVAEACRVARRRVIVDYPAATQRSPRSRRPAGTWRTGSARAPSRIASSPIGRSATRSRATASASRASTGSSCCRLPCTSVSTRVPSPTGVERALAAVGLLKLAGSPVTILAER